MRDLVGCGLRVRLTGPRRATDAVDAVVLRHAPSGGRPACEFAVTPKTVAAVSEDVRWYVAQHARSRVFVHAGAVVVGGRAVLLPGRTLAGKSTLVAELIGAGAAYLSDEFALLDRRGFVHPFARDLVLRRSRGPAAHVAPSQLGATVQTTPVPLGAVVVTRYERGAEWRPRRRAPGAGVMALVDNAVAARKSPRRVLAAASTALRDALVLEGRRGEASVTAARILARLG